MTVQNLPKIHFGRFRRKHGALGGGALQRGRLHRARSGSRVCPPCVPSTDCRRAAHLAPPHLAPQAALCLCLAVCGAQLGSEHPVTRVLVHSRPAQGRPADAADRQGGPCWTQASPPGMGGSASSERVVLAWLVPEGTQNVGRNKEMSCL